MGKKKPVSDGVSLSEYLRVLKEYLPLDPDTDEAKKLCKQLDELGKNLTGQETEETITGELGHAYAEYFKLRTRRA